MAKRDVIILGGGPAGMSALMWCQSLGLTAILLEKAPVMGGQMLEMFHVVPDYPGLPNLTGHQMRDTFVEQLKSLALSFRTGCRVDSVNWEALSVSSEGETFEAKALVLATGARKRRLNVPGETEWLNRGVHFSATRDHHLYEGKRACVVGGGDSAIENSLILSRVCESVTLVHRGNQFRARREWLDAAKASSKIRFVLNAEVESIEGDSQVTGLVIRHRHDNRLQTLETHGVFVKVGVAPNTEMFAGTPLVDASGYIPVDRRQRTTLPRVYAVGDVTAPVCYSVATAVGHGAIAIKDIKAAIEGWD